MRSSRCSWSVGFYLCLGLFAVLGLAFAGCGGGGGGGGTTQIPTATIQGSVSGTIVMAIDETGKIADTDDTTGKTPLPGTSPQQFPFTLTVPVGHQYTIQFIVDEGTATERILPLYVGDGNIFSVASTGTLNLGFVTTSGTAAVPADNNNLPPPIGTTPPPTITLQGYRYLYTRNGPDGVISARFHAEVRDPSGTAPVTDRSLIRDVAFFDNAWNSLPLSSAFALWNGTNMFMNNTAGDIVPAPRADVEATLVQAPSGLVAGFYNVVVTDNAGNLHKAQVYFRQPDAVAKPSNLVQTNNPDNSVTLTWTNPTFPAGPTYDVRLVVQSDDLDGDTIRDWQLQIISRDPTFHTYTIPASFVASNLAGKTGLRWHVQIRQYDNTIVFPDDTSQGNNTQFYRNYSEEKIFTLPAPAVGFSQADLTGTWDVMQFKTSSRTPFGGWFRVVGRFDSSGRLFVDDNTTFQSTVPDDFVPNGDSGMIWTINSAGAITQTGDPTTSGFHGNMASNKQLIVATVTLIGQSGNDRGIIILRKRVPGVTYGIADLNRSFAFHALESGSANGWARGTGNIDGSGQVRLTSIEEDSPPDPGEPPLDPNQVVAQFQIDSNGIVSHVSDPLWKGFLTPDKTTIFFVHTNTDVVGTSYELTTVSLRSPSKVFTLADLEGTYRLHAIWSIVPGIAYGDLVMGAAGTGTFNGIEPPTGTENAQLTITTDGTVGWQGYPTLHGTLSSNGSLLIVNETDRWGNGEAALEFYVK